VSEKAGFMMRNIADVMNFINDNNLELNGDPFLEVTRWNTQAQTMQYDFCFPIKKTDSLPQSDLIKYKEARSIEGLTTIFNGNYSVADKAWYALIDYATQNQIEIELLPIEVYLDDPHAGGDALQWEAKVFMPIKK
jgi:effector-binding domain-containing protein